MPERHWQTKASNTVLLERALMLKNIRAFFDGRSVIEVETPLMSHYATTDPHLDSLQSRFREQICYLNTSPEYAMKRLLVSLQKPIYQLCKAFRDDELGSHHNPEFTLLEWYRPGFDMSQLMAEMSELIRYLCDFSQCFSMNKPDFTFISYQQAFEKTTGINPHDTSSKECYQVAMSNKIEIPQGLGVDAGELNDWLDWLLTQWVLPTFSKHDFTFLYDYPAAQCALAKVEDNAQQIPVARRFELFFGEMELANGFDELTDAQEQSQRFQAENKRRKLSGKKVISIDKNFIDALAYGLPECSGVALGVDRLLMALTRSTKIEQVLSFSWDNA